MERRLTLEDVARYPRPGMHAPKQLRFTPDSRSVLFLFSAAGTLQQQLWRYDLSTGQRRQISVLPGAEPATAGAAGDAYSLEEQLLRERRRVREGGVTEYQAVREGTAGPTLLLVPIGGRLHLQRGDGPLEPLAHSEGAGQARLSPDGARLAFVRAGELFVADLRTGETPRQVTSGAGDGVTNGLAEFIAEEEMGRHEGYWWSPDGSRLAYCQVDSSHIPLYPIVHQGAATLSVEEHRYPFAGTANARLRLGLLDVAEPEKEDPFSRSAATRCGAGTRWLDLGDDADAYLARVAWRPDGVLTAQIQSRDQRTLRLVAFEDPAGRPRTLIEEHGSPWLNLRDDAHFLKSGEILWLGEQTGFMHLYLHRADGSLVRALTEGPWRVTSLEAVDEERRWAYVEGTRDGVLERHLYGVPLDGGPPVRLTREPGWHQTSVAPDGTHFVDRWSHRGAPPLVRLCSLPECAETARLFEETRVRGAAAGEPAGAPAADMQQDPDADPALVLPKPELATLQTPDGTTLHAALYLPPGAASGNGRYPLLVAVYGGPGAQLVTDSWDLTVDLRAQYLAQQGFVVLKVDNRGSANRGRDFVAPIAGRLGHVELEDQVHAVRWLCRERPYVDGRRVGIYGWSYGGYMTCLALMRAPDVFAAGVAGAPVTEWTGYDTHYTERYMGLPAQNAEAYRASSVTAQVEGLRGSLLLVHGLVDENVHFRHTARLIMALTAAGKRYDLLLFPEERHMPRDAAGLIYQESRLLEHFRRHLAADQAGDRG